MSKILQLDPPIPVITPLGAAMAHFVWTDDANLLNFGVFQPMFFYLAVMGAVFGSVFLFRPTDCPPRSFPFMYVYHWHCAVEVKPIGRNPK